MCARDANLGLIRSKIQMMSGSLQESMASLSAYLAPAKAAQAQEF